MTAEEKRLQLAHEDVAYCELTANSPTCAKEMKQTWNN